MKNPTFRQLMDCPAFAKIAQANALLKQLEAVIEEVRESYPGSVAEAYFHSAGKAESACEAMAETLAHLQADLAQLSDLAETPEGVADFAARLDASDPKAMTAVANFERTFTARRRRAACSNA